MADNWWDKLGRKVDQAQKVFKGAPSPPSVSLPGKNLGDGSMPSAGSRDSAGPFTTPWAEGAQALSGLMRLRKGARKSRRGRGR